MIKNFIR